MRHTIHVAMALGAALLLGGCYTPRAQKDPDAIETPLQVEQPVPGAVITGTTPELAWVRPVFETTEGEIAAGIAFAAVVEEHGVMLTAHHLFGPAGGLEREYTNSEIKLLVSAVVGTNPNEESLIMGGVPLELEGAAAMREGAISNDMAVFPLLPGTKTHALPLADALPKIGERIWMVCQVVGGAQEQMRHAAIVQEATLDMVSYVFEEPVNLQATSGAPLINAKGEVVAMNLGGQTEGGKVMGIGNPGASMRSRLLTVLMK